MWLAHIRKHQKTLCTCPFFEKVAGEQQVVLRVSAHADKANARTLNFEQVSSSQSHYSHLSLNQRGPVFYLTSHRRRSMGGSWPHTHQTHPQGAAAQTGCR